ncbi:MAG: tetratricopeptide repeat-containing sulfotransferase family protein [Pseudomonadales bacterium]
MTDSKDLKTLFNNVVDLMKEDAADEAESVCRQALEIEPSDVNFIALLGTVLTRQGKLEEAEIQLRRTIAIAPGFPRAQEDLGTVLLNLKKSAEAIPHLLKAIELNPNSAEVFFKLGGALKAEGHEEKAKKAFARSAELSPQKGQMERAANLFAQGKFREAEKLAQELVRQNPRDVNAAVLMARIAMEARCYGDAEALLRRVVEIAPRFIEAWHDLSTALKEQSKFSEAVEALDQALVIAPDNAISHYFRAAALAMDAKPEEAELSYKDALKIDPRLSGAYLGLGHVLKTVGKQEEGITAYREAIKLRPNLGETYYSLSNLKTFTFSDGEIEEMIARLEGEQLSKESIVHFSFAIGKGFEDARDYDCAFEYYTKANQTHRDSIAYDPVQTEIIHQRIRETFSTDLLDAFEHHGLGCADASPIFILGLPRSGSTLLEQILASHSQVDGTSELPDLSLVSKSLTDRKRGVTYPGVIPDLTGHELKALGEKYIDQTRRHRSGAPHFTDKMPNNFPHIGFIQLILPNAKIIDARRHPLDSCMGCFKQHFAKGQTFTYDLFELGEFYLEYQQMMDHWDAVLPGKVLHVQYEDVVADLETQVRRLLDYCELPFEEQCVNFHETDRAVRTASSEQVRQPIYAGSVNTWKRFEKHLEPLIEVLSPILPSQESGS